MLSLFPTLLSFQQLAPFLLRVTLAGVLLYWAYGRFKGPRTPLLVSAGVVELVVGFLLLIGLFTQLAALVLTIVMIVKLIQKIRTKSFFTAGVNYFFIILIISISVLFLGAGAFAFDLPL